MREVVGDLKMPVVTGWPCHSTSRGRPTFKETIFIVPGLDAATMDAMQKIWSTGEGPTAALVALVRAGEGLRRTFCDRRPFRFGNGRPCRKIDRGRPSSRISFGGVA